MKVACEQCAVVHEIEPPPWIIASGRAFPMTCPACGHGQKVVPSVGVELAGDGSGAYGELDSGTAVLEEGLVRPQRPSAGRRGSGYEEEPDDSDPIVSYRKARDLMDVTVADTPLWRGRHHAGPDAAGDGAGQAAPQLQLRQGEEVFEVPDLATLQRWIMERRVEADDQLWDGASGWLRAGDRPDLSVFFKAVEQLESLDGAPRSRPPEAAPAGRPVEPARRREVDEEGDDHTMEAAPQRTEELPHPGRSSYTPPPLDMAPRPILPDFDDAPTELLNTVVDGARRPAALPADAIVPVEAPATPRDVAANLRGAARTAAARASSAPRVPDPPSGSTLWRIGIAFVVLVGFSLWGVSVVQQPPAPPPVKLTLPAVQPPPEPAAAPEAAPAVAPEAAATAPEPVAVGPSPAPPAGAVGPARAVAPSEVESLVERASDALVKGNLDGAVGLAQQAVDAQPAHGRAQLLLGTALYARQRVPDGTFHLCAAQGKVSAVDEARIKELLSSKKATCAASR